MPTTASAILTTLEGVVTGTGPQADQIKAAEAEVLKVIRDIHDLAGGVRGNPGAFAVSLVTNPAKLAEVKEVLAFLVKVAADAQAISPPVALAGAG